MRSVVTKQRRLSLAGNDPWNSTWVITGTAKISIWKSFPRALLTLFDDNSCHSGGFTQRRVNNEGFGGFSEPEQDFKQNSRVAGELKRRNATVTVYMFTYHSTQHYIHFTATHLKIRYPQISHFGDVIMCTMPSQITSLMIVNWTVYSGADQSKHQSSASLAFVWGNGQLHGKCFHLMTSSWSTYTRSSNEPQSLGYTTG